MTRLQIPAQSVSLLQRREVLALGLSVLSGCGGGSNGTGVGTVAGNSGGNSGASTTSQDTGGDTTTSSLPGTGGTGISVQGPITGFGSVIINGTKYDDSTATMSLDGTGVTSSSLRIGMVATVRGAKSTSTTGTANNIEVWSIAHGPIANLDGIDSLTVAGMTIRTGTNTAYEGCANYAGLAAAMSAGLPVTVWGIQASADAVQWSASRIAVATATDNVIATTGKVSVSASLVTLNGWTLNGSGVSALTDQALVRVQGQTVSLATALNVSSIKRFDANASLNQAEAEVEGLVTSFVSATNFYVGTLNVNAGSAQISLNGFTLGLGSYLSISGALVNGVLVAKQLEVKGATPSAAATLDITGVIQEFDRISEFVLRGQECNATNAVVTGGTLSDLAAGKKVRVVGTPRGEESLRVTQLYFL